MSTGRIRMITRDVDGVGRVLCVSPVRVQSKDTTTAGVFAGHISP